MCVYSVCIQSYSVHVCIQYMLCYIIAYHLLPNICTNSTQVLHHHCNMQLPGVGIGLESLLSTLASDKRLKWWWCQTRNNFRGRGEERETHLTQILPRIPPHTQPPNTHAHAHACMHARAHTHTHTHARARTRTHAHTHTHTPDPGACNVKQALVIVKVELHHIRTNSNVI